VRLAWVWTVAWRIANRNARSDVRRLVSESLAARLAFLDGVVVDPDTSSTQTFELGDHVRATRGAVDAWGHRGRVPLTRPTLEAHADGGGVCAARR
jgi:hypothetical protein